MIFSYFKKRGKTAGFPREYAWGTFEEVEVDACGLIRVLGWAREKMSDPGRLKVVVDDRVIPIANGYRTYRPDVARVVQSGDDFLGFGMEYLCHPSDSLPAVREISRLILTFEGEEIYRSDRKIGVAVPHYGDLFLEEKVLHRPNIYGSGPPLKVVSPEVLALVDRWLSGSTLDFGCGAGALVHALRKKGVEAYGIEIDRPVIMEYLLPEVASYIKLYDGSFPVPYDDDTFESGIAVDVLEHVENCEAVVEELARIIRKRIVVTVPDIGAIPFCHRHNVVPWHLLEATHVNFFTQSSLRKILAKSFNQIEFVRFGMVMINGTYFYTHLAAVCSK